MEREKTDKARRLNMFLNKTKTISIGISIIATLMTKDEGALAELIDRLQETGKTRYIGSDKKIDFLRSIGIQYILVLLIVTMFTATARVVQIAAEEN